MSEFNETLWNELSGSGVLTMVAKSVYPLNVPQRPQDFRPPSGNVSNGPWLTDWSRPPVTRQLPGVRLHRRAGRTSWCCSDFWITPASPIRPARR